MEERLVTPPWIPGSKIGHVYEDISPTFSSGEVYLEGEDPFPDFFFYSNQLQSGANGDNMEKQERSDAEASHVKDVDDGSNDVISRDVPPDRTSKHDCDHFDLVAAWDISIISPPATKPCGPGPKSWIHGLDLLKFRSATHGHPHAIEFSHTLSLHTQYSITQPVPRPDLKSPDVASSRTKRCPCQTTHVVNGVGFMFKIKVWIRKFWSSKPKPRKEDTWKSLSVLS